MGSYVYLEWTEPQEEQRWPNIMGASRRANDSHRQTQVSKQAETVMKLIFLFDFISMSNYLKNNLKNVCYLKAPKSKEMCKKDRQL